MKKLIKICGLFLLMIFVWGCKKKHEGIFHTKEKFNEIVFKDSTFKKALDNFIKETETNQIEHPKSKMVSLYINQESDTILSFISFKPYETVNLVGVNAYKDYEFYFYAQKSLVSTMNTFVDLRNGEIQNIVLEPIDENGIDPFHTHGYQIKNNKIVFP